MLWDAEQSDRHPSRSLGTCIASQSQCPGEPRMDTLCAGKGCRLDSQACRSGRSDLDLDATFHAEAGYRRVGGLDDSSPSLWSGASPTTSGWSRTLTRAPACAFRSPDHSPLLAQRAGAATANAGGIHDPQASISFSAVFVRNQLLVSQAPKRPIELASPRPGRKSGLLSEAGSGGRWTIPRRRSGGGRTSGCLRASRWESRSPPRWCAQASAPTGAPARVGYSGTHWLLMCQASCPQAAWLHQRSGSCSLS
jgi:hypothetical protein